MDEVTKRSSNIELLRLICMFFIIVHHFCVHGGLWMLPPGTNRIIVNVLIPTGKIGFDCFVAISCWFLTKSSFKGRRFVKIWLQVLFYNLLFTALAYILQDNGECVGMPQILGGFFPILGNSHGFAAAYLVFYLLNPILKKIQCGLSRRGTIYILTILFSTQVVQEILASVINYTQPFTSEFLLFVFMYFLIFYLQEWPIKLLNKRWFCYIVFFAILFGICSTNIISLYKHSKIIDFIWTLTSSEFGLLNIIMGILLLFIFKDIPMKEHPILNTIATTTFGILLFHDHNFFRTFIWQIPKSLFDYASVVPMLFLFAIIACSLAIFLLGMGIDALRQMLLESLILKDKVVMAFAELLDSYASEFSSRSEEK